MCEKGTIIFVMPLYAGLHGQTGGVLNEIKSRETQAKLSGWDTGYYDIWEPLSSIDKEKTIFHVFMANVTMHHFIMMLKSRGYKVVISPIIDTIGNDKEIKSIITLTKYLPKFYSDFFSLKEICHIADGVAVRSHQEYDKVCRTLKIEKNKVYKVLNSVELHNNESASHYKKESFLLFVGDWGSKRKNINFLVDICIKYNFMLKIVGKPSSGKIEEEVRRKALSNDHVEILGFLSDKDLIEVYKKAKIFIMPSLLEGTGLAALEAMAYGCNIVITKNGGTADYFLENSLLINPRSEKEIVNGINMMFKRVFIPFTDEFIDELSINKVSIQLNNMYENILKG